MNWLIKLYPRGWRDRYGEEFAALLGDMTGGRHRLLLALDVGRGALDAHLRRRSDMSGHMADVAVRRGVYDGFIVSGLLAIVVVITNVVSPSGPNESDSSPEYQFQLLATVSILAALFVAIGARARRRSNQRFAGARAGAAAGGVIAVAVTLTFLAVNNLFLDIVSRQHDKRVAFAASGWSSMRAFLSVSQLRGAVFLVPALIVVGGVLGLIGGAVFRPRVEASTT
jgi:hypothetical protein